MCKNGKIRESNLIDISKITLENYATYKERIKFEIPQQWEVRGKIVKRRVKLSEEERRQHLKEYQHEYYMKVTKIKRKQKKEVIR